MSGEVTILSRCARSAGASDADVEATRAAEAALEAATVDADAIRSDERAWPLTIDRATRSTDDPSTWIVRYWCQAPDGTAIEHDARYTPVRGRFSMREAIVAVCRHWQQECDDRHDDLMAEALTQGVRVPQPSHLLKAIHLQR